MFKMSKIKLVILALTVIKPTCSTLDYTDIFQVDDTLHKYKKRMDEKGLPLIGESYNDFMQRNINNDFTLDNYKLLMDSIPIIYEMMDQVNKRNGATLGLQVYENKVFRFLNKYYPELYESYDEYVTRVEELEKQEISRGESSETNENKVFIFTRSMFQGLKRIFPNIGDSFIDYKSRMETYGVTGFSYEYFILFFEFLPKPHETVYDYLDRYLENGVKLWKYPTEDTYTGLQCLAPLLGETYEEYKIRMTELDLSSMTLASFNQFQKFHPQLIENFRVYTIRNKDVDFSENTYLYDLDQWMFKAIKNRKPFLYENLRDYTSRMRTVYGLVNNSVILYPEFHYTRRMYPKFSETHDEYSNRLKDLSLNAWPEYIFLLFKKNYPQIGFSYDELHDMSSTTDVKDISVDVEFEKRLRLDLNSFKELESRMPMPFGVYPYYKYKMLKKKTEHLEEDDYEDLKKVFIKQSEIYEEYYSRMKMIGIKPMNESSAVLFKQTIPKRWTESYDDYKIQGEILQLPNMRVFNKMEFFIFKRIIPMPFEYYSNYTNRVINTKVLYDKDINKYKVPGNLEEFMKLKLNNTPLNEEEFLDLKSRYPKLKEKPDDYYRRLIACLMKPLIIDDTIFNTFKQVQVQIGDDYERYKTRISSFSDIGSSSSIVLDFQILSEEDFDSFKSRIPLSFEVDYSSYLEAHATNVFHEDDYNDYLSVSPQYYSTFDEYLTFINDIDLVPVSKDYFMKFKRSIPTFFENKYEEYHLKMFKSGLPTMTLTQFDTFKWMTPKPYEGPKIYETRVKTVNPADTQHFAIIYSLFIRIFPRLSDNYEEYKQYMELLFIEPMDINYFISYKNFFPEHDENDYSIYCNRLNGSENKYLRLEMKTKLDTSEFTLSLMTEDQFNAFKYRLPSVHERYKNYTSRAIDFSPLCEAEFNDLKYQFSLSYESYKEHVQRMSDAFRKPLSLEKFSEEKSMRVLLGERYSEHYRKITQKYENLVGKSINVKDVIDKINSLGIETLDRNNFIEHKLTYTFNYGSFESYCSIMNDHNWKGTPVMTEIWYKRMKAFLPIMCDEFEDYNIRARIYGFPDMTSSQFRRIKNGLPAPGESIHDYLRRTNTITITEPFLKAIHFNFTLLSPKFNDNYPAYTARVQKHGDPMNLLEFKCFTEYLPKIQDDLTTFNNKIKRSGFNELSLESFTHLKLFFPRIYHYTFDNYVLDIGLNHSDMNVVDSLKLTADEFTQYKSKFPRQFELYYAAYCDRTTKDKITKIFSKEDFETFKAANFPLPHEDYYQHKANVQSQGFNSLPKDVFYFFKGIYPVLFEQTYFHRSKYLVTQILDLPDYDEPIYQKNLTKPIVKEIIQRSDLYQELMNKYENLTPHIMTNEQFEEFTMSFPKLFESYSAYKLSMLETTYFPPIDETYTQYLGRIEQIKNKEYLESRQFREYTLYFSFGVVSANEHIYMMPMYSVTATWIISSNQIYEQFVKAYFPEINENYLGYTKRLQFLHNNNLNKAEYDEFVKSFPTAKLFYSAYKPNSECSAYFGLIDKDFAKYKKRMTSIDVLSMTLSKEDYESKKQDYFTSFYREPYEYYKKRTNIEDSIDRVMLKPEFLTLKEHFPSVFKPYTEYRNSLLAKDVSEIMSEETYILLTNAFFPPIYETALQYFDRMQILKNNVMSMHEFEEFTINFPLISKSYHAYKSCLQHADRPQKARIGMISYEEGASRIIDEKLFNSIKNAYFPKLNENFRKYDKRMVSIGFKPLTEKLFYKCIEVYPKQVDRSFKFYKNNLFSSESLMSSDLDNTVLTGMKNIGCVPMNLEAFIMYGHNIPKILQSYENYVKYLSDNHIIVMFNQEQFESAKDFHYPKLTENYKKYSERMEILGMKPVEMNIFKFYKQIYPRVFGESYEMYISRVQLYYFSLPENLKLSENKRLKSQILVKIEFEHCLKNGPRLVEDYKMYLKRRDKEMLNKTNEFGVHSYQMYNQLKTVYMPDQGETKDSYVAYLYSLTMNISPEDPELGNYYSEIMKLYPQFFECYEEYLERTTELRLGDLRLTESEFNLFFSSYPRPFESYYSYLNRRKDEEYVLTIRQFVKYRSIYPRIPEDIDAYQKRLNYTFGYSEEIISPAVFKYFKYIYPKADDYYKEYSDRFKLAEMQGDNPNFILRKELDFLADVLKVTKMTRGEFKSFKLSLPKPYEEYADYMLRCEFLKDDQFKGIQYPLTEDLFNDIKISYPRITEEIYIYFLRLKSYHYVSPVREMHNFDENFEKVVTTSLEHMIWEYL